VPIAEIRKRSVVAILSEVEGNFQAFSKIQLFSLNPCKSALGQEMSAFS
jgi:hypothetical protein